MKSTRWIAIALGLTMVAAGSIAQSTPFEALKNYDWQDRKAVAAISTMIQDAGLDKTKTAAIEKGLITVISDPAANEGGKQEATRFLWMIGTGKSVPALAKMLPDDKLSNFARFALERIADPSAGAALRGALTKTKGTVLVGVINSVGNRHDSAALPALKKLTASPDTLVSSAAWVAISKIGNAAALSAANAKSVKTIEQYDAILFNADKVAAGNKKAAQAIYLGLTTADKPAVIRITALKGLVATQSPKTGDTALALLKANDGLIQRGAARVVCNLNDPAVTAKAIAAFDSLSEVAQIALLGGWADNGVATAAPVAQKALNSDSLDLRVAATYAIAKCSGAKAVETLALIASKGKDDLERRTARERLIEMSGKDASQTIVELALTGKPDVRSSLMGVLVERPGAASMAALKGAAKGTDTQTASAALKALEKIGVTADQVEIVKVLASTKDDGVRDAAQSVVVAIAQRTNERDKAAELLLAALPSAANENKASIIGGLAEIGGDRALAEIINATKSTDSDVKEAAITALAETWADSRPLPTLLEIAKTDSSKSVRVQALRGYLQKLGQDDKIGADDKVAKVADGMKAAERNEEKTQALGVLRDCRVAGAVALAASCLDNADLFNEAANAVIYLAGPQKKADKDLAAVKGDATNAALDKIISTTKDDAQKTQAQQLKG